MPLLDSPCIVSGDTVDVGELHVPGGPAFAVTGAAPHAEVTFGEERASAVLSGDGITLRVDVLASRLEVHPRREMELTPWLVATEQASLVPGAGNDGMLGVVITSAWLRDRGIVRGEDVHASLPCGALSLSPVDWSGWDDRIKGRRVYLTPEDGLTTIRDDQGAPAAEVYAGHVAQVLSRDDDEVRVRLATWGLELTGWIDASDTTPYEPGGAMGIGARGTGGACPLIYDTPRRCDHDLPLFVRLDGGEVFEIGVMEAGTPFVPLQGDGAHVPIVVPDSWFVVYDGFESVRTGAELLVRHEACSAPR
jgi:hypothetical protein